MIRPPHLSVASFSALCVVLVVSVVVGHIVPREESKSFHPPTRQARVEAIGSTEGLPKRLQPIFVPAKSFKPIPEPEGGDWLAEHAEEGQTYAEFIESKPNRPTGSRKKIYLLPIGEFDTEGSPRVDDLRDLAGAYFGLEVAVLPEHSLEGLTITKRVNAISGRRQYLTKDLLGMLGRKLPKDAYCLLGVTMEDLYPDESWNFVFGQATLRRRVGIYSFARNDPRFRDEDAKPGERVAMLRSSAHTLVHETAHMFGMRHCLFFSCVVNGSNSLEEASGQPLHLCPVCLRKLYASTGQDPIARYRAVRATYRRLGLQPEADWISRRLKEAGAEPRTPKAE